MSMYQLSNLTKGATAKIAGFDSAEIKLAMINMGVIVGDIFTLSDIAPFGGPLAIEVNGTKISLRRKDAASIRINYSA